MGRKSQAVKAGLAAGVVFGLLIGLLHLGTIEACSSAQISYIQQNLTPGSNETASQIFYSFDVVYYPMVNGVTAMIIGVLLSIGFGVLYFRIPGSGSKRKGEFWAIPSFLVAYFVGPAYIPYLCTPFYIPYLATIAAVPATFAYGYLLGVFYDAFGRLAEEQQAELEAQKRKSENSSQKLT
jgi:hypothetical protein